LIRILGQNAQLRVNLAWRPSSKTNQTIKQYIAKKEPRGGDGRRERGCSQPHLFRHSIIGSH
jgi:hypothetical protein